MGMPILGQICSLIVIDHRLLKNISVCVKVLLYRRGELMKLEPLILVLDGICYVF